MLREGGQDSADAPAAAPRIRGAAAALRQGCQVVLRRQVAARARREQLRHDSPRPRPVGVQPLRVIQMERCQSTSGTTSSGCRTGAVRADFDQFGLSMRLGGLRQLLDNVRRCGGTPKWPAAAAGAGPRPQPLLPRRCGAAREALRERHGPRRWVGPALHGPPTVAGHSGWLGTPILEERGRWDIKYK